MFPWPRPYISSLSWLVNVNEGSDCGKRKAHELWVYWAVLDGLRVQGVGRYWTICAVKTYLLFDGHRARPAAQLWPPSAAPSQGGAGGGRRCHTGQRSHSLAVMWRGSGRESCILQLSDLFVFWQYEIYLSKQRYRRSMLSPTCQDGCQVKRLYHTQSATMISMYDRHTSIVDSGEGEWTAAERNTIALVFASFRRRWL